MFITFEGIDGAGKSTQIQLLKQRLEGLGYAVVSTREPGGTPIGDVLRQIILDVNQKGMQPMTEALLYAASRAQLIEQVIKPALDAGAVVLCDRYVDASIAYQGAGLGLGENVIAQINHHATGGLSPHLTLLFDLTVETSQSRVAGARTEAGPDRIEQRGAEYFSRVRGAFLRLAEMEPNRIQVIDATLDVNTVEQDIWSHVSKCLGIKSEVSPHENGFGGRTG